MGFVVGKLLFVSPSPALNRLCVLFWFDKSKFIYLLFNFLFFLTDIWLGNVGLCVPLCDTTPTDFTSFLFYFFCDNVCLCVSLPALQSGQQSKSGTHQWIKVAVCPADSEKGLFTFPEWQFILVPRANELTLGLFQLWKQFAIDLRLQQKHLSAGRKF